MKIVKKKNRMRSPARKGFTLIELLTVIAIIAILLVLALPAFENLSHKSLDSAVSQVASTLRLARQYAITHRQYVSVLFPDSGQGWNGVVNFKPEDKSKALSSYAVVAGPDPFTVSEYISEWKYLPQNIHLFLSFTNQCILDSYSVDGKSAIFPFPTMGDAFQKIPAIQFAPNGHCSFWDQNFGNTWNDGATIDIPLISAFVDVDQKLFVVPVTNVATIQLWGKTGQLSIYHE